MTPAPTRSRIRRWWIEGAAAVALLAVLAVVFQPGSAPAPDQAQRWLTRNGQSVDALMADIATTESQLSAAVPLRLARLHHDLLVAGRTPPPPGSVPQKAWATALERTGAALTLLQAGKAGPVDQAAARDDLAAAADALVAVTQAAGRTFSFYPH